MDFPALRGSAPAAWGHDELRLNGFGGTEGPAGASGAQLVVSYTLW